MDKIYIPETNMQVYSYLYCIENALRELIIELLENLDGPHWYKRRLPEDILKKYRQGVSYERKIKWTQLIPHHPVYYIEFADLKKIIDRQDNWDSAFKSVFSRKDIIISTLSEIEVIRNKNAHNRKSTDADLEIIKGSYTKLSKSIGHKKFNSLISKCSCAEDILKNVRKLHDEFKTAYSICNKSESLNSLLIWEVTYNNWWFDTSYLGFSVNKIIEFFKLMEIYMTMPRKRGAGHIIESWIKESNIDKIYVEANREFTNILNGE